ncbi:hypothetical protein ACTID9_15425 [Brevibacillus fluminis]|uniref:hypothetical protein n=1 Tax=Brevibacillus fluminis TaxID=511487 RepID=UPI003F8C43AE
MERSAVDFLIGNGFDKRYGARAIKRAMKQHIELPVAELLLAGQADMKNVVRIARKGADGNRSNVSVKLCPPSYLHPAMKKSSSA